VELTFILTEDCNLRCHFCYQKNFRPTRMSSDVACRAIRAATVDVVACGFPNQFPPFAKGVCDARFLDCSRFGRESADTWLCQL
jgi:hypothetical protein